MSWVRDEEHRRRDELRDSWLSVILRAAVVQRRRRRKEELSKKRTATKLWR